MSDNRKSYCRQTAIEIVRAMERDTSDYPFKGESLRRFLRWSLARLRDRIPRRELDLGSRISNETLALSFLCLLDEYRIGKLIVETGDDAAHTYTFQIRV